MIKNLNKNDADIVFRLEKSCFSQSYSLKTIEDILMNKNYICYGYFKENQLISYIILHDSFDIYEIIKIGTSKDYRKKGYALELLKKTINRDSTYLLEVRESNLDAIKLYEKIGFVVDGRRKNYYGDTGEDAIIMILK